jgi:predicted DNA-binding transcriptional regulator AlpA
MSERLLVADTTALPVVLTTEEAASLLGVSVDHLWSLARGGVAPINPLKLGRAYRWPTAPLLALLGLSPATRNEAPASTAEASPYPLAAPDAQVRRRE